MRDEPREPIGTLTEQIGRHWIWLHCRCGRASKHDPADLAEQLGLGLPLKALTRRARCRACGARGSTLTIQPPYLKDGSDAPRRVPGVKEPRYAAHQDPPPRTLSEWQQRSCGRTRDL